LRYYGNATHELLRNSTATLLWKRYGVHRPCYQGKSNMSQYRICLIVWMEKHQREASGFYGSHGGGDLVFLVMTSCSLVGVYLV
jgi:hypothetical protein